MSGIAIFMLSVVWIISGYITGSIAEKQGRSFFSWFIAGLICFIVAFLYLLLSKPSDETLLNSGKYRKCPHCAEMIKIEAKICRFCGNDLPTVVHESSDEFYSTNHDTDEAVESGNALLSKSENVIKAIGALMLAIILCTIIYNLI